MAEASLGRMLTTFVSIDPIEVLSTAKLFQGEADSSMASLLSQLAAGQEAVKLAQSTSGDLSLEISKLGSVITSLQAVMEELML